MKKSLKYFLFLILGYSSVSYATIPQDVESVLKRNNLLQQAHYYDKRELFIPLDLFRGDKPGTKRSGGGSSAGKKYKEGTEFDFLYELAQSSKNRQEVQQLIKRMFGQSEQVDTELSFVIELRRALVEENTIQIQMHDSFFQSQAIEFLESNPRFSFEHYDRQDKDRFEYELERDLGKYCRKHTIDEATQMMMYRIVMAYVQGKIDLEVPEQDVPWAGYDKQKAQAWFRSSGSRVVQALQQAGVQHVNSWRDVERGIRRTYRRALEAFEPKTDIQEVVKLINEKLDPTLTPEYKLAYWLYNQRIRHVSWNELQEKVEGEAVALLFDIPEGAHDQSIHKINQNLRLWWADYDRKQQQVRPRREDRKSAEKHLLKALDLLELLADSDSEEL